MIEKGATGTGRMRRAMHRVAAGLVRVRELFPLTMLGLVVAALAAFALRKLAFDELDLVALVLGWGVAGLIAASTVLVSATALVLAVVLPRDATGSPVRGETEMWIPTGHSIPTMRFVPLVGIDARIVSPVGIERQLEAHDGRYLERIELPRRGVHERLERIIVVGDVFGLARITLRRTDRRTVFVQPHLGRLGTMPTLRSLATGDSFAHPSGMPEGDRLDLRRYAPGDPARFIHWKIFGRTGKLVVRVPERAIAPSRRVVAYLVAGEDDEATSAAALASIRLGALGDDWTFGADGSPRPTSDVDEATTYIVRSSEARTDGGADLDTFLRSVEREGPTSLVLFVPPRPGAWLDRVVASSRPRGTPLSVVIGVDVLADGARPSFIQRIFAGTEAELVASRADLDAVRSRLSSVGADIVIVERPTGRVIAAHGQQAAALSGVAA